MDYKQIAVKNEQKLKQKVERLETFLINALVILEENGFGGQSFAVEELGMTEKEYKNLMVAGE